MDLPDGSPVPPAQQSGSPLVKRIVIIGAAVVTIVMIAIIVYLFYPQKTEVIMPPIAEEVLSSALVMNLHDKDSGMTGLYSFDLRSGAFKRSPFNYFMPTLTHDEKMLLGSGVTKDSNGSEKGIFRAQEGVEGDTVVYASSTVPAPFWNTQISPSGASYTFEVAPSREESEYYVPSAWRIYLGEGTSAPRFIANGHNARFSPDGSSVLYKTDEGLRIYSVADGSDMLVLPFPTPTPSILAMYDVSRDGTLIAGTNPLDGTITIAPVTSWNPFAISAEITTYEHQAFWPVFSPDNKWLAIESVAWDLNADTAAKDKKLVILNVETGAFEIKADLDAYPQSSITISDWVINE